VKNPRVIRERSPNGGDYSEIFLLDKTGNLAKTENDVAEIRILEKTNDGNVVQTTYAKP
jgi:hypothetical protein